MDIVQSAPFDLVLRGGRVIDPAQGLDGILDVGVRDGRIVAVAKNLPGPAIESIDVRGKLVLPGMIDTHAHVYRYRQRPLRARRRHGRRALRRHDAGRPGRAVGADLSGLPRISW